MLKDYLDALKTAIKNKDKKAEKAIIKDLQKLGVDAYTAYELIREGE